jgi:hypothetical protein
MERPYDTKEGIETYLTDLEGLNRLIKDRHDAGYLRKERLHDWVVLGHWHTDTCGNFGDCTFQDDRYKPMEIDPEKFTLPPVVPREDVYKLFHVHSMVTSGTRCCVPPVRVQCTECGERWTVKNAHDATYRSETAPVDLAPFVGRTYKDLRDFLKLKTDADWFPDWELSVRHERFVDKTPHPTIGNGDYPVNKLGWVSVRDWVRMKPEERLERFGKHAGSLPLLDPDDPLSYVFQEGDYVYANVFRYSHKRCFRLRKSRDSRDYYVQIFKDAGLPDPVTREVPNERCSQECCMPWQVGEFAFGEIKVGWRSSVISIDWSGLRGKPDLSSLFTDVTSTKWPHGVHANTRDEAVEYLKRIKMYLDAGFRCSFKECPEPPAQYFLETADPSSHLEIRCRRHAVDSAKLEHEVTFLEAVTHTVHKL